MAGEPYPSSVVKQMAIEAVDSGSYLLSKHAQLELKKDDLSHQDALNVIRGGVAMAGELENGTWRYRIRTPRIVVVVAFQGPRLRVVTAWRL